MTAQDVRERILAGLPGAEVEVRDTTGGGDHFQARVVAAVFEGKLPIERHRLVHAALGAAMQGPIHALALETVTPLEMARKNKEAATP